MVHYNIGEEYEKGKKLNLYIFNHYSNGLYFSKYPLQFCG